MSRKQMDCSRKNSEKIKMAKRERKKKSRWNYRLPEIWTRGAKWIRNTRVSTEGMGNSKQHHSNQRRKGFTPYSGWKYLKGEAMKKMIKLRKRPGCQQCEVRSWTGEFLMDHKGIYYSSNCKQSGWLDSPRVTSQSNCYRSELLRNKK